jgi:hypothetical protein
MSYQTVRIDPTPFWRISAMKKNDRKLKSLKLNRETIVRLGSEKLAEAKGGTGEEKCTGCPSGCGIIDAQLDNQ